jgi:hypothetical protein
MPPDVFFPHFRVPYFEFHPSPSRTLVRIILFSIIARILLVQRVASVGQQVHQDLLNLLTADLIVGRFLGTSTSKEI